MLPTPIYTERADQPPAPNSGGAHTHTTIMKLLQKNPLTMLGTLTKCWLFAYSTPVETARAILPAPLEPVTYRDRAFWNIVVCSLHKMRPWPLPPPLGVSYRHAAYRLYARFPRPDGAAIEGLWFARSECDSRLMTVLGNILTDYRFHYAPIRVRRGDTTELRIESPDRPGSAQLASLPPQGVTPGSVFSSLEEAAAFLKYRPAGLSVERDGSVNVVRIGRREEDWRSRLVHVERDHWSYLNGIDTRLEVCYEVQPIVYRWNRGEVIRNPSHASPN